MRYAAITLTMALLVASTPSFAQEAPVFEWSGELTAGRTLEIRGLNGDIEALAGDGRRVQVVAHRSARRSDPNAVRIEVEETANGVIVCAIHPSKRGATPTRCSDLGQGKRKIKDSDVVVDFEITVPAGVRFVGKTVNGAIDTRGLDGDVRVYTVNGGIAVSGSRTVEAETVNGAIEASMSRNQWDGTLSLSTVNGSIELALPESVNATVTAETVNGSLSSDFPLLIQSGRRWGPRKLEGTIGSGGGSLKLETVNGGIQLVHL